MQIRIITIGHKTPLWVKAGFLEYQQRLSGEFQLELIELPLKNHGKLPELQAKKLEAEQLLKSVKPEDFCIALDEKGETCTTRVLAKHLEAWQLQYQTLHLLVGGPAGLSEACLLRAQFIWSLSPLTFPHHLVKIILAEQIYRGVSILKNHPYHRE